MAKAKKRKKKTGGQSGGIFSDRNLNILSAVTGCIALISTDIMPAWEYNKNNVLSHIRENQCVDEFKHRLEVKYRLEKYKPIYEIQLSQSAPPMQAIPNKSNRQEQIAVKISGDSNGHVNNLTIEISGIKKSRCTLGS